MPVETSKSLGGNIKARLKMLNMTQIALAERTNLSQPMINKLITGKSQSTSQIVAIAKALQCDPEELLYGKVSDSKSQYLAVNQNVELQTSTLVPLISWVQAGSWCDSPETYLTDDAEEWMPSPYRHGKKAFCLKVIGDSMSPTYREDEIILIDPDVEPRHNDDVVIRNNDGNHTFKRLQITPDGTYLLALNPDHPDRKIKIPAGSSVCGVVIGSWMRRR